MCLRGAILQIYTTIATVTSHEATATRLHNRTVQWRHLSGIEDYRGVSSRWIAVARGAGGCLDPIGQGQAKDEITARERRGRSLLEGLWVCEWSGRPRPGADIHPIGGILRRESSDYYWESAREGERKM